jgi:hypothetical protein
MVEVIDAHRLLISAAPDNLRRLASFIDVPEDAREGWHAHYEHNPGDSFIMPTSIPAVFSLRRLTSACTR